MILETQHTATILNKNSITVVAKTHYMKTVLGVKERTIYFEDIYFLDYVEGNFFTDYQIVIGEKQGKTIIFIPSTKKLIGYSQDFFLMFYGIVHPFGNLSDVEPVNWREN